MKKNSDICSKTPICQLLNTRLSGAQLAASFVKGRAAILRFAQSQSHAFERPWMQFERVSTLFSGGGVDRRCMVRMHIVNTTLVRLPPSRTNGITPYSNCSNDQLQIRAIKSNSS
jgi:hypothetical protein